MNPLLLVGLKLGAAGVGLALLSQFEDSEKAEALPEGANYPGATKASQRANIGGIVAMGQKLVSAGIIGPEVVSFLIVKGYTEARWSWKAGSSGETNAARGMWGLRPKSAWDQPSLAKLNAAQFAALKDPAWAMATALDYLFRVGPYVADGTVNAVEMACGWAFPSLAKSIQACQGSRPELLTRWKLALRKTGLPENWNPELRMSWPGVAQAHAVITS